MKLIKELVEDITYLTESAENGKRKYFIEGVIMQADVKNRNGRIYPKNILEKEVSRYNDAYIDKKRAYGELGHPKGPSINLDRVSHMFTELRFEGSDVVGRAKVMDTPMGKIVKNFIDEGAQLGISSRGLGTLKRAKGGIMEVQNDFMLATAGDIVSDPSGPDCYVEGIMEGADWIFDQSTQTWAQTTVDIVEGHKKEIDDNFTNLTSERALSMFEEYIKSLKS